MSEQVRLAAVAALAQSMAAAVSPRAAAEAAAAGARAALAGEFAAVSRWERASGRLRVLVNDGALAPGEERFPADESYPVHDFPEITEYAHRRADDSGTSDAWVECASGAPERTRAPARGPCRTAGAVESGRARALRRRGRASCVVAPLVLDGRAWGQLYVARGVDLPPYGTADAEFATVLAAVAAAGMAQHERLAEVRRLAFTDPLTGLGNRRAVDQRLEAALARHHGEGLVVSLVVCDINGLKRVNDIEGHEAGDHLLERFGSLLSRCGARLPDALAARLGGDEFCLLTVGPSADEVVQVAEELCTRAAELELGDGVACGVASTGDPIGPVPSAARLLRLADAAQYRAKAARSTGPVVAGREIVELVDEAVRLPPGEHPSPGERRRFRGQHG